jgi:hypothetical protein
MGSLPNKAMEPTLRTGGDMFLCKTKDSGSRFVADTRMEMTMKFLCVIDSKHAHREEVLQED